MTPRLAGSPRLGAAPAAGESLQKAQRHRDSSALELTPRTQAKKAWIWQALGQAKKPRVFSDFRGKNIVFIGKFSSSVAFVIPFVYDWFIQAVGMRS